MIYPTQLSYQSAHLAPILGPFSTTNINRKVGVDYTWPIWDDHYKIVVPLRPYDNYALFLMVFNREVWLAILISVSIVVLGMLLADKIFLGSTDWVINTNLVISRICPDATNKIPLQTYKGCFVSTWTIAVLFLYLGYQACLDSKLSVPKVERKIRSAEDLANQQMIPWAVQEDDNFHIYTSELDPSNMKTKHLITIANHAEKLRLDSDWYGACYTTETKKENQVGNSICKDMITFSNIGTSTTLG